VPESEAPGQVASQRPAGSSKF